MFNEITYQININLYIITCLDEDNQVGNRRNEAEADIVADLVQDAVDNNIEYRQSYTRSGIQKSKIIDDSVTISGRGETNGSSMSRSGVSGSK